MLKIEFINEIYQFYEIQRECFYVPFIEDMNMLLYFL